MSRFALSALRRLLLLLLALSLAACQTTSRIAVDTPAAPAVPGGVVTGPRRAPRPPPV